MKSGIYYILNILNSKIYIGSAVEIGVRWRVHKHLLRNGKHYNKHLQSAWDKYGEDCLIFGILEIIADRDLLLEREQYWINYHESFNDKKGYNLLSIAGSRLGSSHTDETRKKLSESHKGQKSWNKGKKHSDITKEKLRRIAQTDKVKLSKRKKGEYCHSEKAKLKISEALKRRVCTLETKEKMRTIMTGKKLGEIHRQNCINAWRIRKLNKLKE